MHSVVEKMIRAASKRGDALHGETFEYGGCEYVGTFSKALSTLDAMTGGMSERQEYILTAARDQFADIFPRAKQYLSWSDTRWEIRSDEDPQNAHDLILRIAKA